MQMLSIDAITLDERCQPRAAMSTALVDEYADAMTEGAEFPPLTVYRDGDTWYLADGFHRIAAAEQAGKQHVVCDVRRGTLRDAILHAVGANATHGQRRTNMDKRRAVETLLRDPEWAKWSDSEIARRCAVHHTFVGKLRSSLVTNTSEAAERTYTDRYGNVRTMNTENIGKRNTATVDTDTGELLDGESEIEAEAVDPTDPATFQWQPPTTPAPKPSPNGTTTATVSRAESIASRLVKELGRSLALEVADQIYEIADE